MNRVGKFASFASLASLASGHVGDLVRRLDASGVTLRVQGAHLRAHGPLVPLPDVYQLGPSAVRDKASAMALISLLEDHGHIRKVKGGAKVAGQYRRDVWEVRS